MIAEQAPLNVHAIQAALSNIARIILGRLEVLALVDSTNSYLRQGAGTLSDYWRACLAEAQTAGRGRRGRQWFSPPNANLYLSIAGPLPWSRSALSISSLPLLIGIILAEMLQSVGLVGHGIKWPNDIYYQGRKLAGILIESQRIVNGPTVVIIGIGLNVHLPTMAMPTWCSDAIDLYTIFPEMPLDRNLLAARILDAILPLIADPAMVWTEILSRWSQFDLLAACQVDVCYTSGQRLIGWSDGIDEAGRLRLRRPDGTLDAIDSGEVSLRLIL